VTTRAAYRVLKTDPVMAGLIAAAGRYRPQPMPDQAPFEALVRAIAHQQLHGVAAERILSRFIDACGDGCFPSPQQVTDAIEARLRACGFSYAKIAALKDLAAKTIGGIVPTRSQLDSLSDLEIIERLTEVRGIGRWTVEMLLIFRLSRPDVLPVDDYGVRKGFAKIKKMAELPKPKELAAYGEKWKPHRSVAAWYLWRAAEMKDLPFAGGVVKKKAAVKKGVKKKAASR
jgi:DNA-3-methyladenine glycosylase II